MVICLVLKFRMLSYVPTLLVCTAICADVVLVGVSEDSSMPFAIISPDDDVFVSDCEASSAMHCPGVHYVNRSLPEVQDVLSTLSANGTCRDLGPINITILGINCTTPIHPSPTPIPSTTPMQENSISYGEDIRGKYSCTHMYTCPLPQL